MASILGQGPHMKNHRLCRWVPFCLKRGQNGEIFTSQRGLPRPTWTCGRTSLACGGHAGACCPDVTASPWMLPRASGPTYSPPAGSTVLSEVCCQLPYIFKIIYFSRLSTGSNLPRLYIQITSFFYNYLLPPAYFLDILWHMKFVASINFWWWQAQ